MEKNKKRYCKICKRRTEHIRHGFGTPGGLNGCARDECLVCGNVV